MVPNITRLCVGENPVPSIMMTIEASRPSALPGVNFVISTFSVDGRRGGLPDPAVTTGGAAVLCVGADALVLTESDDPGATAAAGTGTEAVSMAATVSVDLRGEAVQAASVAATAIVRRCRIVLPVAWGRPTLS